MKHTAIKSLKDKTVVITGASSGAGRAAAIEFARNGAKLVIAARNMEALDEVEAECREVGAVTIAIRTDVTDAVSVKNLAAKANEFGGKIDVWINNAGVLAAGEYDKTPVEIHEQVIKINLLGYMHGAHAVLPYFKQQGFGILINNISVGGWFPVPYSASYSASKFGLIGFSEALKGEVNKYRDIHICDLFPAFLDTPGVQHAANYTGHILRPAPPVYDPKRVAKSMVAVALHPTNSVTIGSVSTLLKIAHGLFPALSRSITANVIRYYLNHAEPAAETSGNLFAPSVFGNNIYGGWNSQADAEQRRDVAVKTLLITGFFTALLWFGSKKLKK